MAATRSGFCPASELLARGRARRRGATGAETIREAGPAPRAAALPRLPAAEQTASTCESPSALLAFQRDEEIALILYAGPPGERDPHLVGAEPRAEPPQLHRELRRPGALDLEPASSAISFISCVSSGRSVAATAALCSWSFRSSSRASAIFTPRSRRSCPRGALLAEILKPAEARGEVRQLLSRVRDVRA